MNGCRWFLETDHPAVAEMDNSGEPLKSVNTFNIGDDTMIVMVMLAGDGGGGFKLDLDLGAGWGKAKVDAKSLRVGEAKWEPVGAVKLDDNGIGKVDFVQMSKRGGLIVKLVK